MTTATTPIPPSVALEEGRLIERFLPHADITERHEIIIRAPGRRGRSSGATGGCSGSGS